RADSRCRNIADRSEMSQGDLIVTSNLLHGRLCKCREDGHDDTEGNGTGNDEWDTGPVTYSQYDGKESCHIERVVTCQKDILQVCKTGYEYIGNHTEYHDQCGR